MKRGMHSRSRALGIGPAVLSFAAALAVVLVPAGADERTHEDQDIAETVENELLLDNAVSLNDITVRVADGIVTLSGKVNNILAKERAAHLAQTVRGVRSVINQITIDPPVAVSDDELKRRVTRQLLHDPATDSYQVSASVNDGVVTLTGNVDSWQEKQLAATVAKGVAGVQGITNNIDVAYETDRRDAEIVTEIEEALRWDALVDSGLIDVKANAGTVQLLGTIGSAAEKRRAIATAWVAGVSDVDAEELTVKRWAKDERERATTDVTKSDKNVQQAVEDALLYDPRVLAFDIETSADDGTLTLRGTVDNVKAKRAAAEVARNTVGVHRVKNRIKVEPGTTVTDEEIEERVNTALATDPYLERMEVTPSVINGTAYLYGTVDSYFEKAQADDVAARVNGVDEVVNNLNLAGQAESMAHEPYVDDWVTPHFDWFGQEKTAVDMSDSEIKKEINDQMWWSPFVDGDEVNVSVENGIAKLSGTVDSWSEYWSATENAYEGGAAYVDNELDVQS